MMKTCVIIPARLRSARLKEKMLAKIGPWAVVEHTFRRCAAAKEVDAVWVATDAESIYEYCQDKAIPVLMTGEHPNGTSRIAEAALKLPAKAYINVQGDEPFIDSELVDKLVKAIHQPKNEFATAAFTTQDEKFLHNPNRVKVACDTQGLALYFSRSPIPHYFQWTGDKPEYLIHLGIYAFKANALQRLANLPDSKLSSFERLEQLKILENGEKISVVLHQPSHDLAIDTPQDLLAAQTLVELWATH